MYSLDQFAAMIADRVRMNAYTAAIQSAVRPGDVVVDLGCGTGIFALLACSAGASHVYAIDLDGIVEFARHLAAANGFADRIDFLRGDSRQIHLPGRANVLVSDLRGALPLFSHAVTTLEDARIRFLAEDGTLVPLRDRLMAAIVEMPVFHSEITNSWKSIPHLDLSSGLPLVLNSLYRHTLRPQQLLSGPRSWHVLEYASGAEPQARGTLQLCATRPAIGHGIGVWFETELVEGIGFCTEPRSDDTVYGQIFLPWLEPVSLREGDVCVVDLQARLISNDYVWQWETTVPGCDGRAPIHFRQSTFYGSMFSQSCLKKRSSDFVPVLSESGLAERWLLQAMDGRRPLENIAAEAVQLFPHVFRRADDAFNRAGELAEKYSR